MKEVYLSKFLLSDDLTIKDFMPKTLLIECTLSNFFLCVAHRGPVEGWGGMAERGVGLLGKTF
jgi:hypothetical protein